MNKKHLNYRAGSVVLLGPGQPQRFVVVNEEAGRVEGFVVDEDALVTSIINVPAENIVRVECIGHLPLTVGRKDGDGYSVR